MIFKIKRKIRTIFCNSLLKVGLLFIRNQVTTFEQPENACLITVNRQQLSYSSGSAEIATSLNGTNFHTDLLSRLLILLFHLYHTKTLGLRNTFCQMISQESEVPSRIEEDL